MEHNCFAVNLSKSNSFYTENIPNFSLDSELLLFNVSIL